MNSNKISCRHCREEVHRFATICPHCGNFLRRWKQVLTDIKSAVEVVAFVSTAIAIWFLYDTTNITRSQLQLEEKIRDDNQRKSDLADSLTRVQIGLYEQQINEIRNGLDLKRLEIDASKKQTELDLTKTLLEKQPTVCPSSADCRSVGDSIQISINLVNSGGSPANNVVFDLVLRPDKNHTDSGFATNTIPTIVQQSVYNAPFGLHPLWAKRKFVISARTKWTWEKFNLKDSCSRAYLVLYDSSSGLYQVGAMSIEDARLH